MIDYAKILGGVPVVRRPIGNWYSFKVFDKPMEGGSVDSLSLICLPAGYFMWPIWHIPFKKVPVVMTAFLQGIISSFPVLTACNISVALSITKSSILKWSLILMRIRLDYATCVYETTYIFIFYAFNSTNALNKWKTLCLIFSC